MDTAQGPLGVGQLRLAGWRAYTRGSGWVARYWEKTSRLPNIWLGVFNSSNKTESSGSLKYTDAQTHPSQVLL